MHKLKPKNRGQKIFILIILISSIIIAFKIFDADSQPFGISILQVSSNSMVPTFQKGDFIIIKKQSDYDVGDIITYIVAEENQKYYVTHRIIQKNGNEYITKGDANNREDSQIVNNNTIKGKVMFYQ